MRVIPAIIIITLMTASTIAEQQQQQKSTEDEGIDDTERDDETSRKVIGSSVVTSVSVILNGQEPPKFSDAVGQPVPRPLVPPQVSSPINLLNPDRYEFYTFNDKGDLVKRLMTMKEIQSIVAGGPDEGTMPPINRYSHYQTSSGDSQKNNVDVHDIVNNVQKLLTKEMESKKNFTDIKNVLDTPDVSSSWSMILPAVFGNTGQSIQHKPQQVVMTPDAVVLDTTSKRPATYKPYIGSGVNQIQSNSDKPSNRKPVTDPPTSIFVTRRKPVVVHQQASTKKTVTPYRRQTTPTFSDTTTEPSRFVTRKRPSVPLAMDPMINNGKLTTTFSVEVATQSAPSKSPSPVTQILATMKPSTEPPRTRVPSTTKVTTTPTPIPTSTLILTSTPIPTATSVRTSTSTPTSPITSTSTPTTESKLAETSAFVIVSNDKPSTPIKIEMAPTVTVKTTEATHPSTTTVQNVESTPLKPVSPIEADVIITSKPKLSTTSAPLSTMEDRTTRKTTTAKTELETLPQEISTFKPLMIPELLTTLAEQNASSPSSETDADEPATVSSISKFATSDTNDQNLSMEAEELIKPIQEILKPISSMSESAKMTEKPIDIMDDAKETETNVPLTTEPITLKSEESLTTTLKQELLEEDSTMTPAAADDENTTTDSDSPSLFDSTFSLNQIIESLKDPSTEHLGLLLASNDNLVNFVKTTTETTTETNDLMESSNQTEFTDNMLEMSTDSLVKETSDLDASTDMMTDHFDSTDKTSELIVIDTTNKIKTDSTDDYSIVTDSTNKIETTEESDAMAQTENIQKGTENSKFETEQTVNDSNIFKSELMFVDEEEPLVYDLPTTTEYDVPESTDPIALLLQKLENEYFGDKTVSGNVVEQVENLIEESPKEVEDSLAVESVYRENHINKVAALSNLSMSDYIEQAATLASLLSREDDVDLPEDKSSFEKMITTTPDRFHEMEIMDMVKDAEIAADKHAILETSVVKKTTSVAMGSAHNSSVIVEKNNSSTDEVKKEISSNKQPNEIGMIPVQLVSDMKDTSTEVSIQSDIHEVISSGKMKMPTKTSSTLSPSTEKNEKYPVKESHLSDNIASGILNAIGMIDKDVVAKLNLTNYEHDLEDEDDESDLDELYLESKTERDLEQIHQSSLNDFSEKPASDLDAKSDSPISTEKPDDERTTILTDTKLEMNTDTTMRNTVSSSKADVDTSKDIEEYTYTESTPAKEENTDSSLTDSSEKLTEAAVESTEQTTMHKKLIDDDNKEIIEKNEEISPNTDTPTDHSDITNTEPSILTTKMAEDENTKTFESDFAEIPTTLEPIESKLNDFDLEITTRKPEENIIKDDADNEQLTKNDRNEIRKTDQSDQYKSEYDRLKNGEKSESIFINLGETTSSTTVGTLTNDSNSKVEPEPKPFDNTVKFTHAGSKKHNGLKINDRSNVQMSDTIKHRPSHGADHKVYHLNTAKPSIKMPPVNSLKVKVTANHRRPPVQLDPAPKQALGLEETTQNTNEDVLEFVKLCNELAFTFWKSQTSEGISSARSVVISPFALTSMLAMIFLGARGSTSGEMNEMLRLDDMVTFNPHLIFRNITDSVENAKESGLATSAFVRELFSDRSKGKLMNFYKDKAQQFYSSHVEEVNFNIINDIVRRRTNLLVKRHTWGKISEYLKTNNIWLNPPLAGITANIYQTDCSKATVNERDGEMFFQVLPAIRQRRLVPVPAVVWKSGFTAGYDPELDATVVAFSEGEQLVSTIFVMPGQQGHSVPGDNLERLENAFMAGAITKNIWSRLLTSLMERPGLEVQIPRFSHKSFINATNGLAKMGLNYLFDFEKADLRGLAGSTVKDMYISDMVQINTFSTCGEDKIQNQHHIEIYPAPPLQQRDVKYDHQGDADLSQSNLDYHDESALYDPLFDQKYLDLPLPLRPRQARLPEPPRLRFDKPFLYFARHNPTGMILYMGRFNPRLLP